MRTTVEFGSWGEITDFCLETLSRQGYRIASPGANSAGGVTELDQRDLDDQAGMDEPPPPPPPPADEAPKPKRSGAGRPSKADTAARKLAESPVAQTAGGGTKAAAPANGGTGGVTFEQVRGVLLELRKLTGSPDLPRKVVQEVAGVELLDQIPEAKYRDIIECANMKLSEMKRNAAGGADPLGI